MEVWISSTEATSSVDLAMGPRPSVERVKGSVPCVDAFSTVNFSQYKLARSLGAIVEPSVSVPKASGAIPAATDTAEPEEDDPGV